MKKLHKRNNKRVFLCLFFCCVLTVSLFGTKQLAKADWIEEENGIRYENEDGDSVKGFQEIEEKKYYFDKEGYLVKGKFFCEEDQQYYYANDDGVIQTGTIKTKDGFYIADDNGCIQTGFQDYEGNRYFFNGAADMVKGWYKAEDNWYYADENGAMLTGFITVDGDRYYLNSDGTRVSNTVMDIDGTTYVFNEDGSVNENATMMYPVYQFINSIHDGEEVVMNSKIQACALLRASSLVNGYEIKENDVQSLEQMIKSRGIKCNGGYEFSYGGIEGYNADKLMEDMKLDRNLVNALKDKSVKEVGIGMHEEESIMYFDVIFICQE